MSTPEIALGRDEEIRREGECKEGLQIRTDLQLLIERARREERLRIRGKLLEIFEGDGAMPRSSFRAAVDRVLPEGE